MRLRLREVVIEILLLGLYKSLTDSCEMYKFVKEKELALEKHVIKTIERCLVPLCWDECVWLPKCLSINVRQNNHEMFECELNNSSKDASSLVPRQGSEYHEMGSVFAGHCSDNSLCIIKQALAGGWFRFGSYALKLFTEIKTWADARQHCKTFPGGELASIANANKNDFIHQVMVKSRELVLPTQFVHWALDGQDKDVTLQQQENSGTAKYEYIKEERVLSMTGSHSFASVPSIQSNSKGSTFLISIHIDGVQLSSGPAIYSDYQSDSRFGFQLKFLSEPKNVEFELKDDRKEKTLALGLFSVEINTWNQLAFTWNSTARTGHVVARKMAADSNASSPNTSHVYVKDLMVLSETLDIEQIKTAMNWTEQVVWIGLNSTENSNEYRWSDGSADQSMPYPVYLHNSTINTERCVAMGTKYNRWIYKKCTEKRPFICQKSQ